MLVAHEAVHAFMQRHEHQLSVVAALGGLDAGDGLLKGGVDVAADLFRVGVEVGQRQQRTAQEVAVSVKRHARAHSGADDGVAHLFHLLVERGLFGIEYLVAVGDLPESFDHLFHLGTGHGVCQAHGPKAQMEVFQRLEQIGVARQLLVHAPCDVVVEVLVEFVVQQDGELNVLLDGIVADGVAGHAGPGHVGRALELHQPALGHIVSQSRAVIRIKVVEILEHRVGGLFHGLVVNDLGHGISRVSHGVPDPFPLRVKLGLILGCHNSSSSYMDDTIIVLSLALGNGNCRNCCFWNEMAEKQRHYCTIQGLI